MLVDLPLQPADPLLALIGLYEADQRPDKIDLGVGVYRTEAGATPVFGAIKAAEQILLTTQDSKAYLGSDGDLGFVAALTPYVFGANFAPLADGRIGGLQTPGGTGALRLAFALARRGGVRRFWLGSPSWPNHAPMIADLGGAVTSFAHATPAGTADVGALEAAIAAAAPGDAILLHGCCHNPTGIDYIPAQWDAIAARLGQAGLLPILDLAYHGLGHGMEEDAYGVRRVLEAVPEALVAYSCDKNFGVYRDRVGALYAMTETPKALAATLSQARDVARITWSQPPDHGGAAVRLVLADAGLTAQWRAELDAMRARMRAVRGHLAAAGVVGGVDLAPVGGQNGLFSVIRVTPTQVQAMRGEHGIYFAGSGRLNIAGFTMANIPRFLAALATVTRADAALATNA